MAGGSVFVPVAGETRTQYVDRDVTIHEHLAPAADHTRLLKDLEKEARERILGDFQVTGNGVECHVVLDRMCVEDQFRMTAVYEINGRRMETTVFECVRKARVEPLVDKMREAMAKDIAANILKVAMKDLAPMVQTMPWK